MGRALRAWRCELCAYLDCPSSGDGRTEGTNLKIGNAKRGARGWHNFDHHRLRPLCNQSRIRRDHPLTRLSAPSQVRCTKLINN
ncbi:MAG: transposase [Pseudonocardiales bacterium]|nr:transposase [Pseudonocardiales bacterium]